MLMLSGSILTWPHDRQCPHPRFSRSCALHSVVYESLLLFVICVISSAVFLGL